MKMVREIVDAIVLFEKNNVNPMFISSSRGNIKINKVIKVSKERRNLRECYIYICLVEGRQDPIELRWEVESNKWYMEKI